MALPLNLRLPTRNIDIISISKMEIDIAIQ